MIYMVVKQQFKAQEPCELQAFEHAYNRNNALTREVIWVGV